MNKKFLSAVLFGTLMVASTGTFVSCKDYDDDINNLQTQITANADAIKKLQDLMGQGQYVTGVTKTDAGLVFSMSNGGASVTIPVVDGQDGKDGTIITLDPETNNWIIDGEDTGVCAKGEKGDKGEDGNASAGANGHSPQIDAATGCWRVWDDANQDWVVTDQSAIGAQTYVVKYTNPEYFELNVMQQDAEGNNLGFTSIALPVSGTLMSVTPELNNQNYAQNFDIYYGILNADVDWKGHKAVNGKMLAGMYPTADRNIKMQLNPSDVDANNYDWAFVSTDNTTPWGLNFGAPQVWTGKATTATRAVTSANGLWTLPRDVQKFDLNSAEIQGRPDYVTQFKSNDGNKYLFALQGTSKIDGVAVKSSYVYTFQANNVNAVEDLNNGYGLPAGLTCAPSGSTFVPRTEYTPTFDMWSSNNNYDTWAEDSVLVYDYWLEIDKSKITQANIDRYGVTISDDLYRFSAQNDAVINNTIPFIYHYILINGKEGKTTFTANFSDKAIEVVDNYIGDITAKFNAQYIEKVADRPAQLRNNDFFYSTILPLDEFIESLGGKGSDGYNRWIDAIARVTGTTTDPLEITNGIFNRKYSSSQNDYTVELTGGDPINNSASWDVAAYNGTLLNNYISFDYVDGTDVATAKSCLNTGNVADLEKIKGLKVYFAVNSQIGKVELPYYTVDGNKFNYQDVALPLNNAFRVNITTRSDQYKVAEMNFTFELQQPDLTITHENDKFSVWSSDKDGYETLTSYGAYDAATNKMYLPMYEAFKAWTTEYTVYDANAKYYTAKQNTASDVTLLGMAQNIDATFNSDLAYTPTWSAWNTYVNDASMTRDPDNKQVERTVVVEPTFHYFGVYPEAQVKDFDLVFASLLNHSSLKMASGKETMVTKTGTHEVFISNDELNFTTPMGGKFFLFDGIDANEKVVERKTLNEQSFNEEQRPFMAVANVTAIANFTAKAKNGSTTYNFQIANPGWSIDPETGKRDYTIGAPDANDIKVYAIDAVAKRQATGTEVLDATKTMVGGHTGGMVIQLPTAVADQEEIEITLTITDGLEFENNLKFVVKKIK